MMMPTMVSVLLQILLLIPCANPIPFLEAHCFEGKPGKEEAVEEEADISYNPLVAYMTQGLRSDSDSDEAPTSKAAGGNSSDEDHRKPAAKSVYHKKGHLVQGYSTSSSKPSGKEPIQTLLRTQSRTASKAESYSDEDSKEPPAAAKGSSSKSHLAQEHFSSPFKLHCKEPRRKHHPIPSSDEEEYYAPVRYSSKKCRTSQAHAPVLMPNYPYGSYGGFYQLPPPPSSHPPYHQHYFTYPPPPQQVLNGHNPHLFGPPSSYTGYPAPTSGPTSYSVGPSAGYPPMLHDSSITASTFASREAEEHSNDSDSTETRRSKRRNARYRKRTPSQVKHFRHSY
jgi:hypothetical protein